MKQILTENKAFFLFPFIFAGICVVMPEVYNWTGDLTHFKNWASYYFTHGLPNAYLSATDYPPFFQYVLMLYVWMQPSLEAVSQNINQFKYIILVFDLLGVMIAYQWMIDAKFSKDKALFTSLFLFFNVAYLYNTVVWGQVDATYSSFIFIAVYLAYNKQITPTIIFCILAINAKFYVFIFFPLIFLMLLPTIIEKFSLKNVIIWMGSGLLLQYVLLAVFYHNGHLPYIRYKLFDNALVRRENLSSYAYNLWYWVSSDPFNADGNKTFLSIKYKVWGMVMFVSAYFFMILPLFLSVVNKLFRKTKWPKVTPKHYLLIGTLIPLIFLFFPTQMHERYAHPAVIFAAMNAFLFRKYWIYGLVSLAYFLNLHDVLMFKYLNTGYLLYHAEMIAAIFAAAILLIYVELYKDLRYWVSKNQ